MMGNGRKLSIAVWVLGLWIAPNVWAQTDASRPGQESKIEAVERGVYSGVEAGPSYFIASDSNTNYGLGTNLSLIWGFDVLPILNLALGLGVTAVSGSQVVENTLNLDDRFYMSPLLRAQLAVFTTERHFVWLRAEGGVALLLSDNVLPDDASANLGLMVGGGVAYEYFTMLRHFSIGIHAGLQMFMEPDTSFNIFLLPALKYSF